MRYKEAVQSILQEENDLIEIVQLVGKDSLDESQKATLAVAKIIKDEFLQQNAFSKYDYNCPLYKTVGMLKCIIVYYENCNKVLKESQKSEKKISMALIEDTFQKDIIKDLTEMKFIDPALPEKEISGKLNDLADKIESKFRNLLHG